ncbi:nuclear pore complex protein Nup93 [Clonorchis sinensis]|uniref:Nuclear pore protein n=1 Tax=Clonorchis sinensis TaxID=79923 RepID=G7Y2U4_CLOSI|nr:nuclear pore complex protein Nup93 [Clonorchis sinensis]
MDITFDELVQDSEKLLMDVQGYSDLPYITRSLDQIRNLGDKLYLSRGPRSDVKAARLLGNKMSYELPGHLSSKLESMSTTALADGVVPSTKLDIQTFLKTERENALLNVISMTQESLVESIRSRTAAYLRSWWEQEATGVLSALAGSSGPLDTDLLYHHASVKDGATPFSPLGGDIMGRLINRTRDELSYSKQVDQYLSVSANYRSEYGSSTFPQAEDPMNLLLFLAEANSGTADNRQVSGGGDTAHSDLIEVWNLIKRFADSIQVMRKSNSIPAASSHHVAETRFCAAFQRQLIECSLSHLEAEFVTFLCSTISTHPRVAKLGGRPGTRSLVKAFLNMQLPNHIPSDTGAKKSTANGSLMMEQQPDFTEFEDGLVDSKPVWPMIYYCLRAGDSRSAIEVARAASNTLENFAAILEEYVNGGRHLSLATRTRLRQTALQVLKASRDPYKRLIFSILGLGPSAESHSEVAQSIDDFLWVKLSQVAAQLTDSSSSVATWNSFDDPLTLGQLQTLLYETYGEVHFDAWSQPLVYFKLLCLTQQFEVAIAFLARFEALRSHAVHIALGLHTQHLLLLSDSLQSPLVSRNDSDPIAFRRLNLARVIMLYTRKFEIESPQEALMYYHFLADIPSETVENIDDSQRERFSTGTAEKTVPQSLFVTCVTELALATKQFDELLGFVTESGVRKPGAIDRYCQTPSARQDVITVVASALETRGQLIDAISLYQLAASNGSSQTHYYRKAISLTNYLLAGLVSTDDGPASSSVSGPRATAGHPDRGLVIRIATKLAHKVRESDAMFEDMLSSSIHEADDQFVPDYQMSSSKALFYLLDLATFFDLAQADHQCQAAIDHMDQLGLFPSNPQFAEVEAKVNLFSQLPDYVRRPLPRALLVLMRCLLRVVDRYRGSKTQLSSSMQVVDDSVAQLTLSNVRNRAKALVAYVGRIPYKLPGDVYTRITQMHMELM